MPANKEYLGDGVYASFDGMQIALTTEDGIQATNTIYIEAETYWALISYAAKLFRRTRHAES